MKGIMRLSMLAVTVCGLGMLLPVTSFAAASITLLNEAFEGNFPQDNIWHLDGSPTWNDVSSLAYQGGWSGYCAGSDRDIGPYDDNMDAWMFYGPFSLADALSAHVSLMHTYDTEPNFDFVRYTVSTDGINFPACREFSGANLAWTGVNIDFSSTPLGDLCGQPQVWFAIQFSSDSSLHNYQGVWVDNIFMEKTVPAPEIRVVGDTAWGNVEVGTTIGMPIDIHNDGEWPLHVTGISCPSGFAASWTGTIPAGSSQEVYVYFHPTAATSYGGTLTVASDTAGGDNTCTLSGTGVVPQTRIIRLSTSSLPFGNVQVGSSSSLGFTIYNDGNATLHVSALSYPSGFSGFSGSLSVTAGSSQSISVTFSPSSVQTYGGSLTITCDATSGQTSIPLSGTGTTGATRIIRLVGDLSFGNVEIATSTQRTLTIYNDGNSAMTVSGLIYPNAVFTGNWSGGGIAAGSSRNVTVTFQPTSETPYSGNVSMSSDATSGANTIPISGTGIFVPDYQDPSISIALPTTASTYTSTTNAINLSGASSDNVGINIVSIVNNRDVGEFVCQGTVSWSFTGLPLYSGLNYVTAIAMDAAGNTGTKTLVVNYAGDTLYEDMLRSSAVLQEIVFPDNLTPGELVTVQWKVLSYVPVRCRLGTADESGAWSIYKNGFYSGQSQSPWNIQGRHATVYAFEAGYNVPQKPGDFVVWFNVAQMDGDQYMAAVIPDGVDSRPHPTQSKLIQRTILSGGTDMNPQSDPGYWDSAHVFESVNQHKKRSGGTITQISLPDNLVPGTPATCQWKVLAYLDVNSKFSLLNLDQQQIWQTIVGTPVGQPVQSTWNFTDRDGTKYYAKEYTFSASFTVPNHPGAQQLYFLNQDRYAGGSWMSGNIPANVDARPVLYNGMYGRFIERTIATP